MAASGPNGGEYQSGSITRPAAENTFGSPRAEALTDGHAAAGQVGVSMRIATQTPVPSLRIPPADTVIEDYP